ncbi:IclR family transcriptional regulator [Halanaerobium saccharolyticum]|uniref:IclR family transcriptional regulator n=1 Tax=Halanaerobium saccharolyticum TaxID=43595 RepID=A0A4R7YWI0_9FIRM|nr:IclR family transcriptional regulator [Halanaerobium saccharolyticum]RAK06953.1 IclR family transcriptional regulator [Halanaerobium saccharolyticum]TDW01680.1 IclR family transcriptional regulator [Halanaerobium saccharolyticum]TDX53078.1 IclR family transcriptional regulator [Halanaerobium saccharolyticum]
MVHNPTYRVISILQAVSNHQDGFTLSELTKETDIPLGTISPILKTLLDYRFLELDSSTNKYTIGIQSYYIGSSFVSKNSTLDLIRQEMNSLSNDCNETCQLGILKKGQVFYLIKVEGQEPIRIVSEVGKSLPAYTTALGKAILSRYTETELEELYPDGLKALTSNTITDMGILKDQLKDVKATGFAIENGESGEHTSCIAVPIHQNHEIVAGLSVVYPSFRETKEKRDFIKAALLKYKNNIEKILVEHNLI